MENFAELLPEIARTEPVVVDDETVCWKAYDSAGTLLGYAFAAVVPEAAADIAEMQDMDKYRVLGIVDPKDFKIIAVEISVHPEGPEDVWSKAVTEPDFEKQYTGLGVEEIDLSPYGKIDAITDATLSSTWLTNAIRQRIEQIIKTAGTAP